MKSNRQRYHCSNQKKAGTRGNSPGFTLVELMTTLAVAAIMLMTAVPAVNGYFSRHALQYAVNELYGDIQLARMRAAKTGQRCGIQFDVPAANQYTLSDFDQNGIAIRVFKVGNLTRFRDQITFTNSPNAADGPPFDLLGFLPTGVRDDVLLFAPANSNSVYLTNEDNSVHYRILVSAAGGASMDRWSQNTNQWR